MKRRYTLPKRLKLFLKMVILDLNKSINEMKNIIQSFGNRAADQKEKRISDIDDRNLEITQLEEERKLRVKIND